MDALGMMPTMRVAEGAVRQRRMATHFAVLNNLDHLYRLYVCS